MIKQVVELDSDFVSRLEKDILEIKSSLYRINALERPDYLTPKEFMAKVKIGRTYFDILVAQGILRFKKIGRKIYIPTSEVDRFFTGELTIK